jgi:hypothetical protein
MRRKITPVCPPLLELLEKDEIPEMEAKQEIQYRK